MFKWALNATSSALSLDFNILSKLQDKLEIVVSETLPAIAERKQNTIYCKITDKVNSGTGGNVTIRVSPNLGIKV